MSTDTWCWQLPFQTKRRIKWPLSWQLACSHLEDDQYPLLLSQPDSASQSPSQTWVSYTSFLCWFVVYVYAVLIYTGIHWPDPHYIYYVTASRATLCVGIWASSMNCKNQKWHKINSTQYIYEKQRFTQDHTNSVEGKALWGSLVPFSAQSRTIATTRSGLLWLCPTTAWKTSRMEILRPL